jgi:hypothetical protein
VTLVIVFSNTLGLSIITLSCEGLRLLIPQAKELYHVIVGLRVPAPKVCTRAIMLEGKIYCCLLLSSATTHTTKAQRLQKLPSAGATKWVKPRTISFKPECLES